MAKEKTQSRSVLPDWHLIAPLFTFGRRVKDVSRYAQLDITATGLAAGLTTIFVASLSLSPAPAVIALVVHSVYIGDRISDSEDDPDATTDRAAFMRRHKTTLSVISPMETLLTE